MSDERLLKLEELVGHLAKAQEAHESRTRDLERRATRSDTLLAEIQLDVRRVERKLEEVDRHTEEKMKVLARLEEMMAKLLELHGAKS